MSPESVWIVGSGGLLGSALTRALRPPAWSPGPARFSWNRPDVLQDELSAAVRSFAAAPGERWSVLWCAGAGVVGTTAEALAEETRALEFFLDRLGTAVGARPGSLFLASSAGGVYAGSRDTPITEASETRPISDYGRCKLRQEELLEAWASSRPSVSTLIGRISNLYGPGQNLAKPQGLISHLSRCLLHHVPAQVYAPLDTLRDHLYITDAAEQILRAMHRLDASPPGTRVTRIIASGQTVSIGGILSIFARIARRQPRIICSGSPLGRLQPTKLALRTTVWSDLPLPPSTPLPTGILAVYRKHLELLQLGRLPMPPGARF